MGDRLLESLLLLIVGMGGVILSLVLLAGMIGAFKLADERLNRWRIRKYAEWVATTLPVDEVSDELVAVITAAVTTTFRKHVIVRRIRLFDTGTAGAWSSTGRLNIMASHHIAKRKS